MHSLSSEIDLEICRDKLEEKKMFTWHGNHGEVETSMDRVAIRQ